VALGENKVVLRSFHACEDRGGGEKVIEEEEEKREDVTWIFLPFWEKFPR